VSPARPALVNSVSNAEFLFFKNHTESSSSSFNQLNSISQGHKLPLPVMPPVNVECGMGGAMVSVLDSNLEIESSFLRLPVVPL